MTKETLIAAMTDGQGGRISSANADKYLSELTACMDCFEINTPARQASFLAQIGHETGSLSIVRENMNYSAERLLEVFKKYFDADTAKAYAHLPEKIASRVYANRMGNGDESSLDGWKHRGGGAMQMTGKEHYEAFGKYMQIDLLSDPDRIREPHLYCFSAGWEWDRSKLNGFADSGNFEKMTKIINGGLNGLSDRLQRWAKAKTALGVA